jgi:formamidopyrimidine-DNA glycosylase
MPELPEIEAYLHALRPRITASTCEAVRITSFSLLRTVEPPIGSVVGKRVVGAHRIGKRIAIDLEGDLHMVIHLMVAGRMAWMDGPKPVPKRGGLAAFDFSTGTLLLTEAGTKRRAGLWLVDTAGLAALDPGGIEVADATLEQFRDALCHERHTLKRALTDGRRLSGIGGAFADEILHAAKLSPTQVNTNLSDDEVARLFASARDVLDAWTRRRIEETGDGFPTKVTAFHPAMQVHGKFREPCAVCGAPIQRIVSGDRETNYCPGCQTGGRILADRSLSRLLKDDWPRHVDEL